MKEVLLTSARSMLKSLGIVTLMIAITLFSWGEARLLGALFIGYVTAATFLWTMIYRIWKIADLSTGNAKGQMLWGLALRLMVLFIVLFVAIHISVQVFSVTAAGFLLFYFLFMVHLVIANFRGQ